MTVKIFDYAIEDFIEIHNVKRILFNYDSNEIIFEEKNKKNLFILMDNVEFVEVY